MLKPLDKIEPTPKLDQRIAEFLELRAMIEKHEAKHKKYMAQFYTLDRMIRGELLQTLKDMGVESAKTDKGTAYIHNDISVSCSDPEAFMDYVSRTAEYELLNRSANKTACKEFLDEHGKLPPGVQLIQNVTARVRAPTL